MGREREKNLIDLPTDDLDPVMPVQKRDPSFLYPLLLGAIAFFIVVGFEPLNPVNAGWILGRLDPTQHYLGWLFYRNSEWTFPIGLNPLFGQDLSSSIVYSDSIPLLAIPFKLLGPLLPERFHYFGIWLLALSPLIQLMRAGYWDALIQPSTISDGSFIAIVNGHFRLA